MCVCGVCLVLWLHVENGLEEPGMEAYIPRPPEASTAVRAKEGPPETDMQAAHCKRAPRPRRLVGTKIHEPWHRAASDQRKGTSFLFAQRCHCSLNCVSNRLCLCEGGALFYVHKGAI